MAFRLPGCGQTSPANRSGLRPGPVDQEKGPGVFRQSSRSPERLRLIALLGSPARRSVRRFNRFRPRQSWRSVRQVLGSPAIRHLAPGNLPACQSGHRNPVSARSSRSSRQSRFGSCSYRKRSGRSGKSDPMLTGKSNPAPGKN